MRSLDEGIPPISTKRKYMAYHPNRHKHWRLYDIMRRGCYGYLENQENYKKFICDDKWFVQSVQLKTGSGD